jgi:hypothetical protein
MAGNMTDSSAMKFPCPPSSHKAEGLVESTQKIYPYVPCE